MPFSLPDGNGAQPCPQNRDPFLYAAFYLTVWRNYALPLSTTRLFSVDGIGDSEMVFGDMRPRIRHRLPDIRLTVGENLRKNPTRRLRWTGHVARMDESRNAYRVLVGRPEGKRSLGRPRRRWEDNIKMDLREVGYDDRDWIDLA
ncbi:hypothetical protein ANN_20819 [Periplaneta americana]|uniref:Uncharacterized protein n=1 Tax=Periplaneta americana TaxID=6978 RepID=A0ABQ8SE47_PERAM|nr:hypothetical protein ANN_20819 [Periplaneta americana]